jgi:hypothetical protein
VAGSFQGGVIQRPLLPPEDSDRENTLDEEKLISSQSDENGTSAIEEIDGHHEESERVKIETTVLSWGPNADVTWLGKERKLYPYLVVSMQLIFTSEII